MNTVLREFVQDARREFAVAQQVLSAKLGRGSATSMEEYRRVVGMIEGFEKAGELLQNQYTRLDTDPDDMGKGSDLDG